MRKNKPHPAACPCEQCRKAIEKSTESLRAKDNSPNSRLKKLSPEAARTLGYIPPSADSSNS